MKVLAEARPRRIAMKRGRLATGSAELQARDRINPAFDPPNAELSFNA